MLVKESLTKENTETTSLATLVWSKSRVLTPTESLFWLTREELRQNVSC